MPQTLKTFILLKKTIHIKPNVQSKYDLMD